MDIFIKYNMENLKFVPIPLVIFFFLQFFNGFLSADAIFYRQTVGSLQYFFISRSDIVFVINKLFQFMHVPTIHYWGIIKCFFRYFNGIRFYGICLRRYNFLFFYVFCDADWAGDFDDRIFTGVCIVFFGFNFIFWSLKKQRSVVRFSAEAEYRVIVSAAAEFQWVRFLFKEFDVSVYVLSIIYSDNIGVIYLCANPVFYFRMKHIVLDYYFVRDLVQNGYFRVFYVFFTD